MLFVLKYGNRTITKDEYLTFLKQSSELVEERLFMEPLSIHGVNHTRRVFVLSRVISSLLGLNSDSADILTYCSLYHDIGRLNDNTCEIHGILSVEKLKKLDKIRFPLNSMSEKVANYIIENHCIDDVIGMESVRIYELNELMLKKAVKLYKIFKDCDSLDRVRIGDLNPNYLRTKVGMHIYDEGFLNLLYQDIPELSCF